MMVVLRCAPRGQDNGQGRVFVLIRQNIAITSCQPRAKSGSSEFHHLCNSSALYTRDSICPDKTSRQVFYDPQDRYLRNFQLVSD